MTGAGDAAGDGFGADDVAAGQGCRGGPRQCARFEIDDPPGDEAAVHLIEVGAAHQLHGPTG